MKTYDINDIADYVIRRLTADENTALIHLKLQKLLYYIQAWSLGINGNRMFDGKFQAWVHGPVNRTIYDRFQHKSLYGFIGKDDLRETCENPSEQDAEFVDYILDNYAGFTGTELERMTHSELPWQEAREGYEPSARCTVEISEQTMQSFYAQRWKEIN